MGQSSRRSFKHFFRNIERRLEPEEAKQKDRPLLSKNAKKHAKRDEKRAQKQTSE